MNWTLYKVTFAPFMPWNEEPRRVQIFCLTVLKTQIKILPIYKKPTQTTLCFTPVVCLYRFNHLIFLSFLPV